MLCPACGGKHFTSVKLDLGLKVERCADCSGVWVDLDTYRLWRKTASEIVELPYMAEIEDIANVATTARMCPKTGRLMTRVKVSNEAPFRLDYSAAAQGVWLDCGEWDGLHALGLHRQLDAVVSERWQRQLQTASSRERMNELHRSRFGDAAFDELLRIRAWLQTQPNRAEMVAFLNANLD